MSFTLLARAAALAAFCARFNTIATERQIIMRVFFAAAAIFCLLASPALPAEATASATVTVFPALATTISQPFTITVTTTPSLSKVALSKQFFAGGVVNHGAVIGAISVETNPPGGDTTTVTLALSGADAAKFALTSPKLPSNLVIGAVDIPSSPTAGYAVTLSASTP